MAQTVKGSSMAKHPAGNSSHSQTKELHAVMPIQALQTKLVLNLLLKGYLTTVRSKNHRKSISRKHKDFMASPK